MPPALARALAKPAACRSLCLHGAGLAVVTPKIGTLRALEVLSLGGNAIPSIPRDIGLLTRLRKLELDYAGHLKELPTSLGFLRNLEELSLSYTESLTRIPDVLGRLPRLRSLTAPDSGLKAVPRSLWASTSLETLWLPEQIAELPPGIGRLPKLRDLTLSLPALASIAKEFPAMKSLRRLRIQGAGARLPENLGDLAGLEELDVAYQDLRELPASLASLASLKRLDVSGNPIRELKSLVLALPRLRELEFAEMRLKTAEKREIDACMRRPPGKRGGAVPASVPAKLEAAGSIAGFNASLISLLGAPETLASWTGEAYDGLLRKLGRKSCVDIDGALAVSLGMGRGYLHAFRAGKTLVLVEGFFKPKDPLFAAYAAEAPQKAVRAGRLKLGDGRLLVRPATEGDRGLRITLQPGTWNVAIEPERKGSWGSARRIIISKA